MGKQTKGGNERQNMAVAELQNKTGNNNKEQLKPWHYVVLEKIFEL